MCFSATASYASGLAITAVGAATLPAVEDRRELGFAALPLLFGVHQLLEGWVWNEVDTASSLPLHSAAVISWLAVAWLALPLGVPIAVLAFEPERARRTVVAVLGVVGLVVGSVLLGVLTTGTPGVSLASHHLRFELPLAIGWPLAVGYAAATCGPLLASSRGYVVATGVAMLAAMVLAGLAYAEAFASVWCFLAAGVSMVICGHYLSARRRRQATQAEVVRT